MKPVRWNAEERQIVAERAAQILKNQGIAAMPSSNDRIGGSIVVAAVSRAQELLLPDRLRRITTRKVAGDDVIERITEYLKTNKYEQPVTVVPAHTPVPTPEAQCTKIIEVPTLQGFSLVELMSEFARRIEKTTSTIKEIQVTVNSMLEMQEMQIDELAKIRDATWSKIAELAQSIPAQTPAVHKPRVAILGCRKYEFDHIIASFASDKVEFKHYDQDVSPRKITADYAIALKWLSHSWDAQIKSAVPADRYRFLNGGVSTAVQQLKTWFP